MGATVSGYPQVVDQAYDVAGLSQALDILNIMTYDLHGFWDARAAHHSPLYAADSSSQSVVIQGDSACGETGFENPPHAPFPPLRIRMNERRRMGPY